MNTRKLSVGEHNLVANALFLRQEQLRKEAHNAEMAALAIEAEHGEEAAGNTRAYAQRLHEEHKAVFNLETVVRRYTLSLDSELVIPELA